MTRTKLIIIWGILEFIVIAVVTGMWVTKHISLTIFIICMILVGGLSTVFLLLITYLYPPEQTDEGKIEHNNRKHNSWR